MESTQETPYHNSEGWTRHLDTQYQAFYYSHPAQGSRWDDPNEAPAGRFSTSVASPDLQDGAHNQEGVRDAEIVEGHENVSSSSSYSHKSPGTLPKYSGTAQDEVEARQRELKGAMLASSQGSAFLSSENMRETALHERHIVENADDSVVREYSATPVVEGPALASAQSFGVYPQAEQQQFLYPYANAYQHQPFLSQQHHPQALYQHVPYGAYQPQNSQPPLAFLPPAPVGMPAGLYAPISFPAAPESSFSSMTDPVKEPMTDEELYFARLPQGAKRVSYIPTNGKGEFLSQICHDLNSFVLTSGQTLPFLGNRNSTCHGEQFRRCQRGCKAEQVAKRRFVNVE
ncbi:hypothetical protein BC830DRAFT_746980 [Chytriomyces sp. MP71]|nr:hypothetical protein BC830DRAFT_746980 [Chytriomyces sp. MP71]